MENIHNVPLVSCMPAGLMWPCCCWARPPCWPVGRILLVPWPLLLLLLLEEGLLVKWASVSGVALLLLLPSIRPTCIKHTSTPGYATDPDTALVQ